jgi:hypothetical protein
MNYHKSGTTDLLLSEVGFGAWAIGGIAKVGDTPIGWGKTDDKTSVKAIHAAIDSGIDFLIRLIFMDWVIRKKKRGRPERKKDCRRQALP